MRLASMLMTLVALAGGLPAGGCSSDDSPAPSVPVVVLPTRDAPPNDDRILTLVARFGEFDAAYGSAKLKVVRRPSGSITRDFDVELDHAQPGAVYPVSIDGEEIGPFVIDLHGEGELELVEDDDHLFPEGFRVPVEGSVIKIGDAFEATFVRLDRLIHLETLFGNRETVSGEIDFKKDRLGDEIVMQLKVELEDAEPGADYEVTIDGRPLGRFTTNSKGDGQLRMSPEDDPFPAGFQEPDHGAVVRIGRYEITLNRQSGVAASTSGPEAPEPRTHAPRPAVVGAAGWSRIHDGDRPGLDAPASGEDAAAVYDGAGGRMLLFGGKRDDGTTTNQLWSFSIDGRQWTRLASDGDQPPPREDHTLVLDEANRQLVLFGGEDGTTSRDTWCFDLEANRWTDVTHDSAPARESHVAIYDPIGRRMVVFGGFGEARSLDADTWVLDLDSESAGYLTWAELSAPPPVPGRRREHAGVYDSIHRRLIVFGGRQRANDSFLNDVWALDLATGRWSQIRTSGDEPPPVRRAIVSHVPHTDELSVFGGEIQVTIDGEEEQFVVDRVWVLNLPTGVWTDRTPYPRARYDHVGVFVPEYGGTLIYGGASHRQAKEHATWVLETPGAPDVTAARAAPAEEP